MNRLQDQTDVQTTTGILQRVLYFVCQLESCGDEEFMTAMRPTAPRVVASPHEGDGRVVLFSTN